MKRFQFSLSTLLILLTLCGFAMFFWVGWPSRTAEAYVDDHFRKHIEVENPFKEGAPEYFRFEENKPQLLKKERDRIFNVKLVAHKRSTADIIAGRQKFDFGMVEFTICRGKIVSGPTPFFESGIRFYR